MLAEMHKTIAYIVLGASVVSMAQDHVTVVVPSKPSGVVPRWDKGVVEGRTYKNTSVGLELTPAPGLEFGPPELKGSPGTVPLLVTITAAGKERLFSAREVMACYSDALAYYPETGRTTDAYMLRVIRSNQKEGFDLVGVRSDDKLGGITFARQDFKKGIVYEAVLVRACDAQALVFIFGDSDRDAANKLISATELKLDLVHLGCGSDATGPAQR
ncbi:MAG TPA: hypothetical protein VN310_13610 [Candidatus Dormibacteraeota bacterium]|nr:hypothetical protein [Candidatus Dormibacteraeota bacterium]